MQTSVQSQEILVNLTPREVRVALVENGNVCELHIERSLQQSLTGNIYKGRVNRLLPGIQAAFVDIGLPRAAFLHISDLVIQPDVDRPYDIREYLTNGQEILVQVYKDPLGSKGARLTTQFTLPARYLVLTPEVMQVAVSQKITAEAERERLQTLVTAGAYGGFIFRTVAEGVTATEVATDKMYLETLWAEILANSKNAVAGTLVYTEIPMVLRVLRDMVGYHIGKVQVDNAEAVAQMQAYAERYMPNVAPRIEFYAGKKPIFDLYQVDAEIQKALERKVPLKSGGHIIIEQTEAMTTIDVNTGSYLGHQHVEETILRTNLEAVAVIAQQIRLRNLGGIIIIDFIDMDKPEQKEDLLRDLTAALAKDSVRTQMSELSSLGLVQLTRKRTRESLEHILCRPCPTCERRGYIKSPITVGGEIFRELRRLAQLFAWPGFLVKLAPVVAAEILPEELNSVAEELSLPIQLHIDESYAQEQFAIVPLGTL